MKLNLDIVYLIIRTWKEYLSYKKECDNEKRRVEKMANEGRDEYDLKKAVQSNRCEDFELIGSVGCFCCSSMKY